MAGPAELGVAFLLFVIGLELSFERLMTMRRLVFGLGLGQVALSAAAIGAVAYALGQPAAAALIIGFGLALSSTAMVVELLSAKKRMTSSAGRASFAVLLCQDIAVIPLLFLVSVLGAQNGGGSLLAGLAQALRAGRRCHRRSSCVVGRRRCVRSFASSPRPIRRRASWRRHC